MLELVAGRLAKLGPQSTWSKHAFSEHVKSDVNKTNFVESFNSTLGIDRCRPILTLLEGKNFSFMLSQNHFLLGFPKCQ